MHVPDADAAVAGIVRVTKPGGRVSIFDFDWDTFVSIVQTSRRHVR